MFKKLNLFKEARFLFEAAPQPEYYTEPEPESESIPDPKHTRVIHQNVYLKSHEEPRKELRQEMEVAGRKEEVKEESEVQRIIINIEININTCKEEILEVQSHKERYTSGCVFACEGLEELVGSCGVRYNDCLLRDGEDEDKKPELDEIKKDVDEARRALDKLKINENLALKARIVELRKVIETKKEEMSEEGIKKLLMNRLGIENEVLGGILAEKLGFGEMSETLIEALDARGKDLDKEDGLDDTAAAKGMIDVITRQINGLEVSLIMFTDGPKKLIENHKDDIRKFDQFLKLNKGGKYGQEISKRVIYLIEKYTTGIVEDKETKINIRKIEEDVILAYVADTLAEGGLDASPEKIRTAFKYYELGKHRSGAENSESKAIIDKIIALNKEQKLSGIEWSFMGGTDATDTKVRKDAEWHTEKSDSFITLLNLIDAGNLVPADLLTPTQIALVDKYIDLVNTSDTTEVNKFVAENKLEFLKGGGLFDAALAIQRAEDFKKRFTENDKAMISEKEEKIYLELNKTNKDSKDHRKSGLALSVVVPEEDNGVDVPPITDEDNGVDVPPITDEDDGVEVPPITDEDDDGVEVPPITEDDDGVEVPPITDEDDGVEVPPITDEDIDTSLFSEIEKKKMDEATKKGYRYVPLYVAVEKLVGKGKLVENSETGRLQIVDQDKYEWVDDPYGHMDIEDDVTRASLHIGSMNWAIKEIEVEDGVLVEPIEPEAPEHNYQDERVPSSLKQPGCKFYIDEKGLVRNEARPNCVYTEESKGTIVEEQYGTGAFRYLIEGGNPAEDQNWVGAKKIFGFLVPISLAETARAFKRSQEIHAKGPESEGGTEALRVTTGLPKNLAEAGFTTGADGNPVNPEFPAVKYEILADGETVQEMTPDGNIYYYLPGASIAAGPITQAAYSEHLAGQAAEQARKKDEAYWASEEGQKIQKETENYEELVKGFNKELPAAKEEIREKLKKDPVMSPGAFFAHKKDYYRTKIAQIMDNLDYGFDQDNENEWAKIASITVTICEKHNFPPELIMWEKVDGFGKDSTTIEVDGEDFDADNQEHVNAMYERINRWVEGEPGQRKLKALQEGFNKDLVSDYKIYLEAVLGAEGVAADFDGMLGTEEKSKNAYIDRVVELCKEKNFSPYAINFGQLLEGGDNEIDYEYWGNKKTEYDDKENKEVIDVLDTFITQFKTYNVDEIVDSKGKKEIPSVEAMHKVQSVYEKLEQKYGSNAELLSQIRAERQKYVFSNSLWGMQKKAVYESEYGPLYGYKELNEAAKKLSKSWEEARGEDAGPGIFDGMINKFTDWHSGDSKTDKKDEKKESFEIDPTMAP